MALPRAERGQKELLTDYPIEEGIDNVETQTQVGRISNLVPTGGSKVLSRTRVLL
jgi:hypothetical protein